MSCSVSDSVALHGRWVGNGCQLWRGFCAQSMHLESLLWSLVTISSLYMCLGLLSLIVKGFVAVLFLALELCCTLSSAFDGRDLVGRQVTCK